MRESGRVTRCTRDAEQPERKFHDLQCFSDSDSFPGESGKGCWAGRRRGCRARDVSSTSVLDVLVLKLC